MSGMTYKAHLPAPTIDSAPFWEACKRDTLLLQHCGECGLRFFYARRLCPGCGSQQLAWEASAGSGTVFSYSEVQVSFFGPEWDSELPYTVVLIDLDEGPRMLSRLVGNDRTTVRTGDRVNVVFVEVEQQKLPFFELARGINK
jgi:uncharacterized OB-fold protein